MWDTLEMNKMFLVSIRNILGRNIVGSEVSILEGVTAILNAKTPTRDLKEHKKKSR